MSEELGTLTFEVDIELYNVVAKICAQHGTTPEKIVEDFIRFAAIPENLPRVKQILGLSDQENQKES